MTSNPEDLEHITLSTLQKLTNKTELVGNRIIDDLELFCQSNSLITFLIVFLSVLALFLVTRFIRNRLRLKMGQNLNSTATWIAFAFTHLQSFFILALSIYGAAHFLILTQYMAFLLRIYIEIAIILQLAIYASVGFQGYVNRLIDRKSLVNPTVKSARPISLLVTKALVWSSAALFVLEVLGFDVSAILAGLGIGGVALALASKNILEDLFASISIIADNPFHVGETIETGDIKGRVEYIGMKTTQIRGEKGELIYCPNSVLTGAKLKNLDRTTYTNP